MLAVRCTVDPAFGLSRADGLAWMDAARYGDMAALRRIARRVVVPSAAAATAATPPNSHSTGGVDSAASSPFWRLAHYNGQGTSYGFVGSVALHWAAANGDVAMCEMLLSAPFFSSVNVQNLGGSTPLHSACSNGRFGTALLLLRHGANPTLVDVCGDCPIDVVPPPPPPSFASSSSRRQPPKRSEAAARRQKERAMASGDGDGSGGDFSGVCDDDDDPYGALRGMLRGVMSMHASISRYTADAALWPTRDLRLVAEALGPYLAERSDSGYASAAALVERSDYVTVCEAIVKQWAAERERCAHHARRSDEGEGGSGGADHNTNGQSAGALASTLSFTGTDGGGNDASAADFLAAVHERHVLRLVRAEQSRLERLRKAQHDAKECEPEAKGLQGDGNSGGAADGADAEEEEEDGDDEDAVAEEIRLIEVARQRSDAIRKRANALLTPPPSSSTQQSGNSSGFSPDYKGAIRLYTSAIAICPTNSVLYSNRAACFLGLARVAGAGRIVSADGGATERPSALCASAVRDCRCAMLLDVTYVKPIYRLAQALLLLGRHGEAADVARGALQRAEGKGSFNNGNSERPSSAPPPDVEGDTLSLPPLALTDDDVSAFRALLAESEVGATSSSGGVAVVDNAAAGSDALPSPASCPPASGAVSSAEGFTARPRSNEAAAEVLRSPPDQCFTHSSASHRSDSLTRRGGYVDPVGRRPWFDCPLCENRTRDRAEMGQCCGASLCGTCLNRKVFGGSGPFTCPFCSATLQSQ